VNALAARRKEAKFLRDLAEAERTIAAGYALRAAAYDVSSEDVAHCAEVHSCNQLVQAHEALARRYDQEARALSFIHGVAA
jgi:hypothetical protein